MNTRIAIGLLVLLTACEPEPSESAPCSDGYKVDGPCTDINYCPFYQTTEHWVSAVRCPNQPIDSQPCWVCQYGSTFYKGEACRLRHMETYKSIATCVASCDHCPTVQWCSLEQ